MITKSCRTARLLHFKSVSSFTAIIKLETDVLNEKRSTSSSTLRMILCSDFNSALVGSSSDKLNFHASSWNSLQNLRRNLKTPSMPLVFHGLLCSKGPKNISYMRRVSAP